MSSFSSSFDHFFGGFFGGYKNKSHKEKQPLQKHAAEWKYITQEFFILILNKIKINTVFKSRSEYSHWVLQTQIHLALETKKIQINSYTFMEKNK